MGLFTFIICFLILLLIVIIIGTIQEFTLWIVTKKSNLFVVMIIPALVSLITFLITIFSTYYILNLFDINTLDILFSKLMNWEYNFNNYIGMILGYLICSIIYIILQALCLKLVNIKYYKIYDFIKYKILKKDEIKELNSGDEIQAEKDLTTIEGNLVPTKISFFHYIATSLFTFAIFFFSLFLLISIGIMIGEKYII